MNRGEGRTCPCDELKGARISLQGALYDLASRDPPFYELRDDDSRPPDMEPAEFVRFCRRRAPGGRLPGATGPDSRAVWSGTVAVVSGLSARA